MDTFGSHAHVGLDDLGRLAAESDWVSLVFCFQVRDDKHVLPARTHKTITKVDSSTTMNMPIAFRTNQFCSLGLGTIARGGDSDFLFA